MFIVWILMRWDEQTALLKIDHEHIFNQNYYMELPEGDCCIDLYLLSVLERE